MRLLDRDTVLWKSPFVGTVADYDDGDELNTVSAYLENELVCVSVLTYPPPLC